MNELQNASAYKQAEAYILDIPKFTSKNGLEHTKEAIAMLGNPAMEIPTIHVAGTNGKGSVCAYLNAMLMADGKKVGLFTSPHLLSMCERIQIDGKEISEAEFVAAYCVVKEAVKAKQECEEFAHPSFFEYLFLMAMYVFERQKVDVIILETGLGGRLDATNVVTPKLSVITEIGLDHMAYLGDTIEAIAFEKAGIIKEGVPVVYAQKRDEASRVIEEKARKKHAKCIGTTKEMYSVEKSTNKNVDFLFYSSYYNRETCVTMPIWAPYQYENLAIALNAYECFSKKAASEQVIKSVSFVKWPCRFEEILPGIVVDGAHNEDGVNAFIEAVRLDGVIGERTLLFGAVADKAYEKMLSMLLDSKLFSRIILTGMKDERAVKAYRYETIFEKRREAVPKCFAEVTDAFLYAREFVREGDVLYIAGSLYLAGYIQRAVMELKDYND